MNGPKSANKKQTFDIQPKLIPDGYAQLPAALAVTPPGVPVSVPLVPNAMPVYPCKN
jgi:hypothetical protein